MRGAGTTSLHHEHSRKKKRVYDQKFKEAADRFIEKLRVQCARLASSPYRGRLRPELARELRSYRLGNYLIFCLPTETGIEIARVLHGARDLPRMF